MEHPVFCALWSEKGCVKSPFSKCLKIFMKKSWKREKLKFSGGWPNDHVWPRRGEGGSRNDHDHNWPRGGGKPKWPRGYMDHMTEIFCAVWSEKGCVKSPFLKKIKIIHEKIMKARN